MSDEQKPQQGQEDERTTPELPPLPIDDGSNSPPVDNTPRLDLYPEGEQKTNPASPTVTISKARLAELEGMVHTMWKVEHQKAMEEEEEKRLQEMAEAKGKVVVDRRPATNSRVNQGLFGIGVGSFVGEIVTSIMVNAGIPIDPDINIPQLLEDVITLGSFLWLAHGALRRQDLAWFDKFKK